MTAGKKTHHRPGPSLRSTHWINPSSLTPLRDPRAGGAAAVSEHPCSRFPMTSRIMPEDHQPTAHLGRFSFLSISCNVNPGTTDARLPGQGRHGGRSQDTDAGDAMVRSSGDRANRPPCHQRIPGPPGFGVTGGFGEDFRCFRARNLAFRANSAIRINSDSRCFCNGVSASRTSFRSRDLRSSS